MIAKILEFIRGLRQYNYTPPKNQPAPQPKEVPAVFALPEMTAQWDGVVWHHSATKDNPVAKDWDGIRKYHMSWRIDGDIVSPEEWSRRRAAGQGQHFEKPWSDIGYHLGIERVDGKLVVHIGRSWMKAGAHAGLTGVNHYNEHYLGCCLIGNFDKAAPDQETMDLCLAVTRQIAAHFNMNKANILGHREVYDKVGIPRQKTCPGSAIDLELFRSKL